MLTALTMTFRLLVWFNTAFYDFCRFRSVHVSSVYKLQFFFTFILVELRLLTDRRTEDGRTRDDRASIASSW